MPAAAKNNNLLLTQKVLLTPNLKDKHNEEDVQRWKCCFFWKSGQNIQLDCATDNDHTQDTSIPGVPMIHILQLHILK
jgi:hypothetical protein